MFVRFVSHLVFGQQLFDVINEMDSWCPELEEFQNEIIDFGPQWYIGKSLGRDKEMEKWNKIFKIAFFFIADSSDVKYEIFHALRISWMVSSLF